MSTESMRSSIDDFERALGAIAARVFDSTPGVDGVARAVAIAYSGGLDSSVLLHLAHDYAARHGIVLYAFHIHHGLSAHADAWLDHCRQLAGELGIAFDSRRVAVTGAGEDGIESAARSARYAALGALCRQYQVPLLLTAHHQDDQAETVLLQLLRGSGVAGLSGMDQANHAPALLGDAQLLMGRPLLTLARTALEELGQARAIAHVDDPSNQDPRYARNAMRHRVMPALAAEFPGFAQRFARTARHAQSAQRLLVELGAQDLELCSDGDAIDIDRLRSLSADRSDNLLRYWFGVRGMRMPSTAWLHEMRSQLLGAKADAQVLVGHADCDIHRHRNRIVMTPRIVVPENAPQVFVWQGEPQIRFADFGGRLCFDPVAAGQGVDAAWLRAQSLTLRWRSGGWRLKLAPNRSTRSLKYHYQDADVPAWERFRLPLVTLGKQLVYAAGLGMDCHHFSAAEADVVALRWEPDPL